MRRALGAQLAAFRQAAQLSQGQLAKTVTMDRTTVAHIEKGRSRGDERFWRIADDRCRAGWRAAGRVPRLSSSHENHEVRTLEAQLTEARTKAEALRAKTVSQLHRDADCPGEAGVLTSSTIAGGVIERNAVLRRSL